MIELISEEKINSLEYFKIRSEFLEIWNRLFLGKDIIDKTVAGKYAKRWPLIKYLSTTRLKKYSFIPKMAGGILNSELILYSNQLWSARNWEYPWAILNSKIMPEHKILDIGSGHSLFPLYLAKKSDHVECIDLDAWQMKVLCPALAAMLKVKVSYHPDDALHLSANDNTFDYVFSISVLEHFEEEIENGIRINKHIKRLEKLAIRECLRVVKPGGRIILTLQYGNENSDKRSFTIDHITDLAEEFKANLLEPVGDYNQIKFTKINEGEMSRLIAGTFPYPTVFEPTGSIGIILTK